MQEEYKQIFLLNNELFYWFSNIHTINRYLLYKLA